MKIAIIIQARCDSERFPKKILKKIEKNPVLWHVIERCKKMNLPIVVNTSERSIDDPIVKVAHDCGVNFFRGSPMDVLDRYYQTAKKFSVDLIIRITADCPLIDPIESLKVVEALKTGKYDYVALDGTKYPDGLDTEGFTFTALSNAWNNAQLKSEREHVTPFIKKSINGLRMRVISVSKNLSHHRWTVDYPDDLKFVQLVYSELYQGDVFHMDDILELLEKKPELMKINYHHIRNEGYLKSLKEDEEIS